VKGGTLAARTSLKKSRAKLASFDKADQTIQSTLSKRAQKGAVTRGNKNLAKALKSNRTRLIGVKPNANTIKKNRPASLAYVTKSVNRAILSGDPQRAQGDKSPAKKRISAVSKANTIKKKRTPVMEARPLQKPASQRPGSMTSVLRGTMQALAQADARRIRDIESITGQKVKSPRSRKATTDAGDRVRKTAKGGKVSDTLRAGLRELAQSDARTMREMSKIMKDATPKVSGGKGKDKLKETAKPKLNRTPKTKSDILRQTQRIIEKASAKKEKSLYAHVEFKNEKRIKNATKIREAIFNPPKQKKQKRDPSRPTSKQLAVRRWHSSMDAWNRAQRMI
jgi:hypothetical protein